jgi:hypothetical protein
VDHLGMEVPTADSRGGNPPGGPATMALGQRAEAARRDATWDLLEMTLEVAVPLRMWELRHATGEERIRLAGQASGEISRARGRDPLPLAAPR